MDARVEGRLNVWNDHWDHRPAECPCDDEFLAWLGDQAVTDATIFHFGTGGHHLVGLRCAEPDLRNCVVGITASPAEHDSFVRLATERPALLRTYTALFGDIYLVNPRLLPRFHAVTLFHLCEFRDRSNDAYGAMSDLEVAHALTGNVLPGGHVLFYTRSFAWEREAAGVVAEWARTAPVERVGAVGSLLVYRKRG